MSPWLLVAITLLLLVPGTATIPLIDRDEPRFAQATREMMRMHEWIVPYFNGQERFDKPILTYWMMRASYALFGVNELTARLHSIASALALVLVIYFMGRRWFSARTGFWAALGMATCFQMLVHGRSAVADMPMVLFVTVAMWAIWELLGRAGPTGPPVRLGGSGGPALPWLLLLYIGLGLGFLAKGPIALIVPALTLILYRFVFVRQPLPWSRLKLHLGIPLLLLIIGAWGIPALVQTDGRFWQVGIGEHVIARGTKAFNKRMFLPIYYPLTFFISLFPWCAFVVTGYRSVRKNWSQQNAFLLSWFLAPYLVFTFYATQLPHYVMPAFPAFFLMLGQAAPALERRRGLIAAWILVAVLAIPAAGYYLRPRTPAIELRSLFDEMPAGAEMACYQFREPSLVFYSNRKWEILNTKAAAEAFLEKAGPRLLVAPDNVENAGLSGTNITAITVSGFNIARTERVKVRALYRK